MQELLHQISAITQKIESEYPELYRFLDENPIALTRSDHPEVNEADMEEYLKSLQLLLKNHVESRK